MADLIWPLSKKLVKM